MMPDPKEIAGFRVLSKLGTGAASTLYAVQEPKSKQIHALKHVEKASERDQRFIEQCITEYEVGTKLDHPNIRHVRKLIRHRRRFKVNAASLVMELVDALPLDERMPSSQLEAIRVFRQVAAGLSHMHGRGWVHADIKPNNILVDEHGKVKIIDLGQGCRIGTVKTRIQGTPGYMAPEQAHRQAITPQTDVYNLGATMYWVLVQKVIPTAMPPKNGDSALYSGAVDTELLKLPTPPHELDSNVHPLLSRQVMDCIQLDPADRTETMQTIVDRLELIIDLLEVPHSSAPPIVDDETTTDQTAPY